MSLRHVARLLAGLLALAALAAVPGGPPPAMAEAPARVALVHAVPLAGAEVVTVATDGTLADVRLGAVAYGEALRYQDVAAGSRSFKLYAGDLGAAQLPGATPALTAAVTLEPGKDYTLVAVGGARGYPLELIRLEDNATRPPGAAAKIRLVHAAPFAAPASATAVDIVAEDGQAVPGLLNIAFKGVSDYATVPTGVTFDLKAVPSGRPGAPPVLDIPPFSLVRGQVRTLVAIGGANARPPALVALDLEDRLPTTLRVIHAAPALTTPVQVTLNGRVRWSGLTFGADSGPTTVDEGSYTIVLEQPGDPPGTLASARAELRRDREYIVLIRPDAEGEGAIVTVEGTAPLDSGGAEARGKGTLRVYHVAPFHTDERSQVDLRDRQGRLVDGGLAGIAFGAKAELLLPAREYDLLITSAGGGEVYGEVGPFTLEEGRVATILIVGDKDGGPSGSILLAEPVQARYFLPLVGRQ